MKRLSIIFLSLAVAMLVIPTVAGAADAPDGAAIFKAKCAMCHGPDGKGETTMGKNLHIKNLGSEEVQKQKNEDLEKIITDGKGKMPSYKGKLSEAEIDAVVNFLRTFAPKKQQ